MSFLRAIVISLLVHAALAGALVLLLTYAPAPDKLAQLDLSSVELSLAEEDKADADIAPSMPSPASKPEPARSARDPRAQPPPEPKTEQPKPPEPEELKPDLTTEPAFARPEEKIAKMEPPDPAPDRSARDPRAQPPQAPSPAVAPRQAKVDAPPRPIRAIRPEYPKGARQRGEQGVAELMIDVGADGSVTDAHILKSSGFGDLDAAAIRAVKAARFRPAESGGHPVPSSARLALRFRLR